MLPKTMSFKASVLCEAVCSVLGDVMAACASGESANEGEVLVSMVGDVGIVGESRLNDGGLAPGFWSHGMACESGLGRVERKS